MIRISAIVPTYNRANLIAETLDCLVHQETNGEFDYEVIVVDNNSKDRTKAVVGTYLSQFPDHFTYLYEPKQSRAHALNAGLKIAKGDIITCVDDDCHLEESHLLTVYQTFQRCGSEVGVIGGKIYPQWIGGEPPSWLREIFSQPARFQDGSFNHQKIGFEGALGILDLGSKPFIINEVCIERQNKYIQLFGANMSFRKDMLVLHGDFSSSNVIGEDTEICSRFIEGGVRCLYEPSIQVFHKIPANNGTPKFFLKWWYGQGLNLNMAEEIRKQSSSIWRMLLALTGKALGFYWKTVTEKNTLMKIHYRTRVFYQLGQMMKIFRENINVCKFSHNGQKTSVNQYKIDRVVCVDRWRSRLHSLMQKRVSRFVSGKWRMLIYFIREQLLLQTIDLEKAYVNSLTHIEVLNLYEILESSPDKYPDYLLKDSYDVQFLKSFKDKIDVTDDEIKGSLCYQSSCEYRRTHGTFNGMNNEVDILRYCRSFLDFYRAFNRQPYIQNRWKNLAMFNRSLGGDPPVVVRILNSDYSMILGGHHRLSCLYVLGERFVKVRVDGYIKNCLPIKEEVCIEKR